jgi:hypothetical protein
LQLLPGRDAKSYHVQISTDGGKTWVELCLSTQTRRIVVTGLIPGTTYAVRACHRRQHRRKQLVRGDGHHVHVNKMLKPET